MARLGISVLLSLCSWMLALGYPNGAPETSCFYMTPRHLHPHTGRQIFSQADTPPYNITVSDRHYRPDQAIRVTIHGAPFKGFILVAGEEGNADWPSGVFYSEHRHAKTIYCAARNDAVTHTHGGWKESVTVLWYGPEQIFVDPIYFVATVIANVSTYWTNVKSPVLMPDPRLPGYSTEARGEPALDAVIPGAMRAADPWLNTNRGGSARRGLGGLSGGLGGGGGQMNLAALFGGAGFGVTSPTMGSNPLSAVTGGGGGSAFSPGNPLFKLLLGSLGG